MTEILNTGKLLNYKEFRQYGESFIETGCAAGDGVQRALDAGFKHVFSIEASEYYHHLSKKRFALSASDVLLFLGKSIDRLPDVLQLIEGRAVIFLDAHVSGDTSAGYEDWKEKGEDSDYAQDKTIKAELAIILANNKSHVIIIDDVNGLTDGHAVEYMDLMLKANPDYKFYFYDENLSGDKDFYYKNKILVAIP